MSAVGNAIIANLIAKLSLDTSDFVANINQAKQDLSGITKANAGEKFRESLVSVGKGMTVAGGAIVGAAGIAAKAAVDFESAFTGVRKTVNYDGDDADNYFNGLRDSILAMSEVMPTSASEIADVMATAGQLGIESQNLLGFTEAMIGLGSATNLSAEEAAVSLAQFANVMQMDQTQFGNLGSSVVALGNNFATNEAQIVNFAQEMAIAGKLAGLSEADVLGFGTAMASMGLDAASSATAFQRFTQDIISSVASGGGNLETFAGVAGMSSEEFQTMWGEDATGALLKFFDGLGAMDAADQLSILDTLGIEQQQEITMLQSLAGNTGLLTDAVDMSNLAWQQNSALQAEVSTRNADTASQMAIVKNQLTEIAIEAGSALLPVIKDILESLAPLLKKVTAFVKANPKLVATITKIGAALLIAGSAITGVFSLINKVTGIVKVFSTLGKSFNILTGIGAKIAPLKGIIIGGFTAMKGAIASFGASVISALAPILPIIAVIAAAIALFALAWKKNWLGIGDTMNKVVGKVKSAFSAVGNYVNDLKAAYDEGGFSAVFSKIGTDAANLWNNSIKPWFDSIGNNIRDFFTNFDLGASVSALGRKIGTAVSGFWTNYVSPKFTALGTNIKNFFTNLDITESLSTLANSVGTAVSGWWQSHISPWFEGENGIGVKIKNFFANLDLSEALTTLANEIKTAVSGWWDLYIKTPFDAIITFIKAVFSGADLSEALTAMVNSIKTSISTWWETYIAPQFSGENGLGQKFKDFFSQFEWGEALITFVGGIGTAISNAWATIKEVFTGENGFLGKVKGWLSGMNLQETANTFTATLGRKISSGWATIKTTFTGENGLLGKVKGWLGEIDLSGAAGGLVNSIKTGIAGAWESFKTWFTGLFDNLFGGITIPDWLNVTKWFGGKKDEGEQENGSVDMPEGMMTLDYNNLMPIPEETLASYQALATAIAGINTAIGGGEEGQGGLNAALEGLPAKLTAVLTASQQLGDYWAGSFVANIGVLLRNLVMIDTDREGSTDASGGNTLYNAFGVIYILIQDIFAVSQQLAEYWSGGFVKAIHKMKEEGDYAIGMLEGMSTVAKALAAQFAATTSEVYNLIDAYTALRRLNIGGGGSGNGKGAADLLKASGGPVTRGNTYIVGEQGPELFTPSRSGWIVPNDELSDGHGQPQITVNVGNVYGERYLRGYVVSTMSGAIRKELRRAA